MKRRPIRLRIIFIQALIASCGSLYFGFFGDPWLNLQAGELFNPANAFNICPLCRFARILMYPLTFIAAVGLIRNDHKAWMYMLPSVTLGLLLEIYHNFLMWQPSYGVCSPTDPCTTPYLNYFGFVTIPLLCLTAFVTIATMIIRALVQQRKLK